MSCPRLLDLFCKAGGASRGYMDAGFLVVGVDIEPQPNYCGHAFYQADALEFVHAYGHLFDAIAASPPCQAHTRASHLRDAQGGTCSAIDLVEPTRAALIRTGLPYVIENVPGAPLVSPTVLCGSMFGLKVRRHRLFEANPPLPSAPACRHKEQGKPVGVYHRMNDRIPHGGTTARTLAEGHEAMGGLEWMRWDELKEAIPPAYTSWVGRQMMEQCFPNRNPGAGGEP
jgi:DNA (cytosine-5)-methyltransferase 1